MRDPGKWAFHHPPPHRVTPLACVIFLLLINSTDMGNIVTLLECIPALLAVVAFIQTQVLRGFVGRRRALDHHSVERGFQ
jgi:hypothetical protein